MVKKKDSNDPSNVSIAYEIMLPKWKMIDSLLGGTSTMRIAGEEFLPRHSAESGTNYGERLESTTLFNMMELTLETLVGKPFSNPIKLRDDVPSEIAAFADDVDLQGNDITTFSRNVFRESIAKAFSHVIVDFPMITEEERALRTLEDDRQENRRPYWVFVKPENVIFASATFEHGREVLEHVRIAEDIIVRVGFTEEVRERIRVLEPGRFELWELQQIGRRQKRQWIKIEEGITDLPFIPLLTFYANRDDLMLGKPPLEDLAFLNVRHWQSTSDQINVLTVARFPMLAVAGATDQTGNTMAIGPRQLLGTKDPQGRFYYVEHTGKAIEAGRQDLLDLEQMMASYGAEFLKRRPGNTSATARALDSAEAMSFLQDVTVRFQDFMSQLLDVTAAWLGMDDGGTVDMITDFGGSGATAERLTTLLTARYGDNKRPGDLSREDFLLQLKELQILSDDFDPRVNLARLMMEAASVGFDTNLIDPDDVNRTTNEKDDDDGNEGSDEE